MPELPEAQTIASDLDSLIKGAKILSILPLFPPIVDPSSIPLERLLGKSIKEVTRLGKMIHFHLQGNLSIIASLRMTGQFLMGDYPNSPKESAFPKHTRLAIKLDTSPNGLFYRDTRKFGRLFFLDSLTLKQFLKERSPGVDALEITPKLLQDIMGAHSKTVKAMLMDQNLISGLGNIYATESLFKARIAPTRMAYSLTAKECKLLSDSIIDILNSAITHRGSTIKDYMSPKGPGSFQDKHLAYGKAGKPCPHCGRGFSKVTVCGRATVWCQNCQK
ncbi:MAG: bifunctional DNA-formamidopyrimidine glycosylase/DNA-(apurinic or apyrimidinic site) lyase [Deltaproteobacteria bacterium]|jgi:formamidopyrimidine-DNA glycosylase|nr:bifunctional DNA-formamidopyrimidine glycosylase/DNA-(apurinic or apyrimidinic site) lyase [Deltaproteobacteria bacterium]